MKNLLKQTEKLLLEHWVLSLLGSGGIVASFFGWIYRTYLKDWLLSKHSLEMYGLVFILVFLAIAGMLIRLIMLEKKRKRLNRDLLTDANDIKGAINDWFNSSGIYIDCQFEEEENIYFQSLDDTLNIKKGSSKKYLPILAKENGYGIEIGEKTFRLV